jgi:hypothetical protein
VLIAERSSPPVMYVSRSTLRRIAKNAGDYESIRSDRGLRLQAKLAASNGDALWIRGGSADSNGDLYVRARSGSNGSGLYVRPGGSAGNGRR